MKEISEPHPDHDRGLEFDVQTLLSRRAGLSLLAGAGVALLAACAPNSGGSASTGAATSSTASAGTAPSATSSATATPSTSSTALAATCEAITPTETKGPYPGDGSNGPNVLIKSGIIRSDIRSSFGESTTTAQGVPLHVTLTVLSKTGCKPLPGAAVYLWQANQQGQYSLYDKAITNENYLRGVQAADANGKVEFTTIFPGAYAGRWPHIHFEVYESIDNATQAGKILSVSQLALPEASCTEAYATAGYEQSVRNMRNSSLAQDMVFGDDGGINQLATMSGNPTAGYQGQLNVVI